MGLLHDSETQHTGSRRLYFGPLDSLQPMGLFTNLYGTMIRGKLGAGEQELTRPPLQQVARRPHDNQCSIKAIAPRCA